MIRRWVPTVSLPAEIGYASLVAPPFPMSDRARELIAGRFRALGEPMRLKILERLFRSPAAVGEVLHDVGGSQANVSKHLAVLRSAGLVERRRLGSRTVYAIADPSVERLCAVVCDAVQRDAREEARALASPRRRRSGG